MAQQKPYSITLGYCEVTVTIVESTHRAERWEITVLDFQNDIERSFALNSKAELRSFLYPAAIHGLGFVVAYLNQRGL